MKLIDPLFTTKPEAIFKKIYSNSNYGAIAADVLKRRLSLFLMRRKEEDSVKLPPLYKYDIKTTIADPSRYLLEQIKVDIKAYVDEHLKEYEAQVIPNWDKLNEMIEDFKDLPSHVKKSYLELVKIKMNRPMSAEAISATPEIKAYEKTFSEINSSVAKDIIKCRKMCTAYYQILLGKAMGIFFIRNKIDLLVQIIKENVNEIADIITTKPEKKVIIFSTFVDPLHRVKELLEAKGIGCIVHTGGEDIVETKRVFKNDNSVKCLLGTTGSMGTGVDSLQLIADLMIFLNVPYRKSDEEQCVARLYRKGQDTAVKVYFISFDTGKTKNLLNSEAEINEWSRMMFKIAID
jgi:SNF2 family DNA or RNA helicase